MDKESRIPSAGGILRTCILFWSVHTGSTIIIFSHDFRPGSRWEYPNRAQTLERILERKNEYDTIHYKRCTTNTIMASGKRSVLRLAGINDMMIFLSGLWETIRIGLFVTERKVAVYPMLFFTVINPKKFLMNIRLGAYFVLYSLSNSLLYWVM